MILKIINFLHFKKKCLCALRNVTEGPKTPHEYISL